MRKLLPIALSSLLLLAACNSNTADVTDEDMAPDITAPTDETDEMDGTDETDDTDSAESVGSESSDSSDDAQPSAAERIIEISADDWSFAPNSITVQKGEKVVLRVTGVEGKHSFAIAALDINVPIEPGETKDIPLPTDTAGTFEFRCRIPCGPGHMDMKGTLTIV